MGTFSLPGFDLVDVMRTIKYRKSLFRNKKGIENEVTYLIHKYSSAINSYTIQAANKKGAGQTVRVRRLICTFLVRTYNQKIFSRRGSLFLYIITEIKRYNLWTSEKNS